MTDTESVEHPVDTVTEVAEHAADDTGAAVPVVDEPPKHGEHDPNCVHCAKIDSLSETVSSLADSLAAETDPATSEDPPGEPVVDTAVQDVTPAGKPWTHRSPFKRD